MGHSESKTAAVDVSTGPIEYSVTVHTGEKRHSGTDASVYVQLYGDKGVSAEHKLHHESKKDFKKGHVDTHIIVDSDIGNLWKVEIWKIDKTTDQIDCDWFVKRLEITLNLHPDLKKSKSKKNIKTSSSDSPSLTQTQETRTSFDYENNAESNSPEAQSPRARSPTTTSPPTQSPPPEANPNLKSSSGRRLYFAFPCFQWIQGRVEVWEGTSVLPQHETNPDRIRQRKDELERKKGMYQWKVQEGWPSFIKSKFADLPRNERWTDEKLDDFMSSKFKAGANFALEKVKEKFHNWKDFDDYKELFNLLPVPKLQKLWKQDETFGRLRIQGVNPVAIRRVTQFPIPKFGVTTEMVQDFIRPGSNLDSEMKANRLYYIEYSNFAEYSLEHFKEGRYISSPICLFYVNEKKLLVPIAIQLSTKIPYDPHLNPIFTPKDQDDPEWLLAKMCFANVDAVSHQLISHLLNTHLVSEPFLVALHRQFATCHPVYKLLLPHFKFQLAVNCRAREILIAPGGPVDDVMPLKIEYLWGHVSKGFKKWRFDRADFPTTLRDRDITENPDDLPGYYYRDDGLLLWEIIKSFVKEQLGIYYKHDRDVKDDVELQAWAAEIAEVGFSGLDNGWPDHFSHLDDLVQAVTTIIWTVSAQHASVNFQQFEHFGFIPANPGSLFIAPPGTEGVAWERGKITLQDIFKGLPPKIVCAKQIAISYVLSQFSSEDDMLGMYPETLFTDEKDMASIDHYKKQLSVLEHKIMERGEYIELSPKRIPNSTAV